MQEFYHNGNPELKQRISEMFYNALAISANPFNRDIQAEIDGLKEINFDYKHECQLLKKRYIVYYHTPRGVLSGGGIGLKHKFLVHPTDLYCGSNGHLGALRMKYEILRSEYVGLLTDYGEKYIKKQKESVEFHDEDCDVDCRKLFHYVTYYCEPTWFQGTQAFDTLEEAERYFDNINYWTHYTTNGDNFILK